MTTGGRVVYTVTKNKKKGNWTRHDTRYLKNIIKYMPHLYVCEITKWMQIMSSRYWSESYIYKNLRKLGWSLQVVFERARQIDLQERANYKYALHYYLKHPRQIITLDETHRGKKLQSDVVAGQLPVNRHTWTVSSGRTVGGIPHYVQLISRDLFRPPESLCSGKTVKTTRTRHGGRWIKKDSFSGWNKS